MCAKLIKKPLNWSLVWIETTEIDITDIPAQDPSTENKGAIAAMTGALIIHTDRTIMTYR